jgi:hypothetical protein
MPEGTDLEPLFRTIIETIPAPSYDPEAPLQAHVTNLDASNFLGRLALLRVHNGTIRKGQTVAWCKTDGTTANVRISELLMTEGLERKSAESAGPGDIIAIAGIPEITIGETLADIDDPRPLPVITIDGKPVVMPMMLFEQADPTHLRTYYEKRDLVERAKPDPDLFLAAAERLGADMADAVVVGDSIWDLLAARRARALGIGLLSGGYGREELERAGAYRVYEDPADLLLHLDEVGVRHPDDT